MAEALRKRVWAERLTRSALLLSIGGVLAALIGAWGSGQGAWTFGTGFLILRIAFFAALSLSLVGAFSGALSQTKPAAPPFHLLEATIDDVQAAFRTKQLTCRVLVELYLRRIEA